MSKRGRRSSAGVALFFALSGDACAPPELRACRDFVDHLVECTDRNPSHSEAPDDLCEEVHPDCERFFACAAERSCVKDPVGDFYTLDLGPCAPPEGISCP